MSILRKSCTASLMVALCCLWMSMCASASMPWDLWIAHDSVEGFATSALNRARNGRIAFERAPDIYTANADGTDLINLTNGQGLNTQPAYSPDGSRIAFVSDRAGNDEIYTMNTDGSGVIRVTVSRFKDAHPDYSPDGKRLVFTSNRNRVNGAEEIFTANIDGSNVLQLTNTPSGDYFPVYSPDGTKIAFSRPDPQVTRIYTMNAHDGSNVVSITAPFLHAAVDYSPGFSPDGRRIVFHRWGGTAFFSEVRTVKPDGSDLTLLTGGNSANGYTHTSYAPDGSRILCSLVSNNIAEILPDGTTRVLIPNGMNPVWQPLWRPIVIEYEGD